MNAFHAHGRMAPAPTDAAEQCGPQDAAISTGAYNEADMSYNDPVPSPKHFMTVSRNGQVSIPAAVRSRWRTRRVVIADLGDRVVIRPMADDPIATLQGKYANRGPDSTTARRRARTADAEDVARKA